MVNRAILLGLVLYILWGATGCRASQCCRHTAAKPKMSVELEVGYTHTEKSKYQEDCASIKTKWRREL